MELFPCQLVQMGTLYSNEHWHEKGENTWRAEGAGPSIRFPDEESEAWVSLTL